MRVLAAVAFASAVLLTPALAAAQATSAPSAPTALATNGSSGANLDEVICKNSAPPTGSRLGGGRECHTQREWNQRQSDAQNALLREQQSGFKHPGG
jgi:cytochrome c5